MVSDASTSKVEVLPVITMTKTMMTMTTIKTMMMMMVIISKSSLEPLVQRKSFLVLELGFDIVNGVRHLNVQVDGLACEHLDEDVLGGDFDDDDDKNDKDDEDDI